MKCKLTLPPIRQQAAEREKFWRGLMDWAKPLDKVGKDMLNHAM